VKKSLLEAVTKGKGNFPVASHWCKKKDGAEVGRCGLQQLLTCEKGPTNGMAILNKSDKS
jgi:hypothetical protein